MDLRHYFELDELCDILPTDLDYKFTQEEYSLVNWIMEQVLTFLESLE
jgi:hypothetical protein